MKLQRSAVGWKRPMALLFLFDEQQNKMRYMKSIANVGVMRFVDVHGKIIAEYDISR